METEIKYIDNLCVKITDGSHFSPEDDEKGQYPMYSVKDMEYNSFSNQDCKHIGQDVFDKLSRQDCRPLKDDIVIAKDGSYLKYVFKVKEDLDACILSSIAILRPNKKVIDPDYFVYLMRSASVKNAMANYVSGSALPRIILSDFKKMKIAICSDLNKQKHIASILSAYDSQIENNQKRIKLLEQMAENLYKEWFVRFRFPGYENAEFEGGVPKGWKVAKVKDCVNRLKFGALYDKSTVDSEGDVIVIDQSQDPYIGFHNNAPSHVASITNPIVLFGDHSCKFELMIIPFSLAENVVPFMATTGINTIFLFYSTHKLIQTTEYKRHWTEFVNKKIFVPPTDLQLLFAEKVKNCFTVKQNLLVENRYLIKQRDLLLPRLMSGKLSI